MELQQNNSEIWQVEFGGDIRDVSFEEMTQWIAQGSLVRIDRVKKGNLRWIEAGKVPALTEFFNAKDLSSPSEPVVTTNSGRSNVEVLGPKSVAAPPVAPIAERKSSVFPEAPFQTPAAAPPASAADVCAVHPDTPAAFICDTCASSFCKACPNSYGGTVKICPFCGAMCKSVAAVEKAKEEVLVQYRASTEGFGISDFFNAFAYPFKYPVSLVLGALMFAFFSVGQGAASFGGAFMLGAAIMCFMCANMLSFGVLANVVENFSQGKIGGNFMPSFDDFNLWDDVVHPFFLSIGVYISSFGPLAAVFIVSIFLLAGAIKPSASSISPEVAAAPGQLQQGQSLKDLIAKQNARQQDRIKALADASAEELGAASGPDNAPLAGTSPARPGDEEERRFQDLNNKIADARKAQLEGAIGKTPETQAAEQKAMLTKILGYGAVFLLVAGLCLLWGLFYLPAACCVAGYTRSFAATLNPTVGLDTIKRLGGDYAKLLAMGLVILIVSGMVSFILAVAFSVFNLPGVGNLPAKFISSIFGFYLSVVFSCTLGFAIYKASDRLQLFKG